MIKVLVVDDSAIVRQILSQELSKAADIEVVGTAIDPYVARDKILSLRPDVLTLDLEMPRMGGLAFLSKLMNYHPMPVIVVSSLTPQGSEAAIRALELGAVEVIAKPGSDDSLAEVTQMLVNRIRAAFIARNTIVTRARQPVVNQPVGHTPTNLVLAADQVLAIGASTGGPEAIKQLMLGLPANCPGTVIVQHMPAKFTASFAERLNTLCLMEVREARDGDLVVPGLALVAPGSHHMTLRRNGDGYRVGVKDGPRVHYQRPSVDVLFYSVAEQAADKAVGVLLTGMGADGARGLLAMRLAGACTLAQDEKSCTVFGMPREALRLEAVERTTPLTKIPGEILRALSGHQLVTP